MSDIYKVISNNIKKYRKLKNLKQKDLSELSGYSYEFIRRIEAPNTIKRFSIETVYIISKVLEVPIKNLFEEGSERSMELKKTFYEKYSSEFEEYISSVSLDLRKSNSEYKKDYERQKEILTIYPNINKVIEGTVINSLNTNEINALCEYLDIQNDMTFEEYKEIFFKGYGEAFYSLQRAGFFKDEELIRLDFCN